MKKYNLILQCLFLISFLLLPKTNYKKNIKYLYSLKLIPLHTTIYQDFKKIDKLVLFFQKNNTNINNNELKEVVSKLYFLCKYYKIDIKLCLSIIKVESNFKYNVISSKNAIGLMQILPKTAKFLNKKLKFKKYNLLNPKDNIEFGCFYLYLLHKKFKKENEIIINYNMGINNFYFNKNNKYLKKVKKQLNEFSQIK